MPDDTNTTEIVGANASDQTGFGGLAIGQNPRGDSQSNSDLLIGVHDADPSGKSSAGRAYLVHNVKAIHPSQIDLANATQANSGVSTFEGSKANDRFGESVALGKRVDEDPIPDLLIGAPYDDRTGEVDTFNSGRAYLFKGRDLGTGSQTLSAATADFILEGIDSDENTVGDNTSDLAGKAVAFGNFDSDALSEVVIAAPGAEPASPGNATDNRGQVYVHSPVTSDTTAPGVPVITAPLDGSFHTSLTLTIEGEESLDGSIVDVFDQANPGTILCSSTVLVDPGADWSCGATFPQSGTYTIYATAVNGILVSDPSNLVTLTLDGQAPPQPTALNATGGAGFITITWTHDGSDNGPSGLQGFEIFRSSTSGGQNLNNPPYAFVGAGGRSFKDEDAPNGGTNHYLVVARDKGGLRSAPSNEAAASSTEMDLMVVQPSVFDGFEAQISGSKIVWHHFDGTGPNPEDVYFYDLGPDGKPGGGNDSGPIKLSKLTAGSSYFPAISGNQIVWYKSPPPSPGTIYRYDLGPNGAWQNGGGDDSGEVVVGNSQYPRIEGTKIVTKNWLCNTAYNGSPWGCLAGDMRVWIGGHDVSGSRIVRVQGQGGIMAIQLYDLGPDGLPQVIAGSPDCYPGSYCEGGYYQLSYDGVANIPEISGNLIVWWDSDDPDHVRLYDLAAHVGPDGKPGTGDDTGPVDIRPAHDFYWQMLPAVDGRLIAWSEYRYGSDGTTDIYVYDVGPDLRYGTEDDLGESRITANESAQWQPDVSGNIIVWEDYRTNPHSIYMATYIPPDPNPNPPFLDPIGNKTVNTGNLLTFTVIAQDADGDPLTLTLKASSLPSTPSFIDNGHGTATFTWTPASGTGGVYSGIRFEASDGTVTDFEEIAITVVAETGGKASGR